MEQILLTVEDKSLVPKLKAAVRMLQGVVSVKVVRKAEGTTPSKDTIKAIEEVRSGHYAGKLDASSKDSLLKSIMEI